MADRKARATLTKGARGRVATTLLVLAAGLALIGIAQLPAAAAVQTQTYTATVPADVPNWDATVSVPQFNPSLGDLESVTFTLGGTVTGSVRFENLSTGPSTVDTRLQATITLEGPDGEIIVTTIPLYQHTETVTAFDGTFAELMNIVSGLASPDFTGTSGRTYPSLSATDSDSVTSTDADILEAYTGTGNITIPINAVGESEVEDNTGNLWAEFDSEAAATVTVVYTYTTVETQKPAGSIGDYVWLDADRNGAQDDGAASGINGVTVTLEMWDASAGAWVPDTTAVTNSVETANHPSTGDPGYYLFVIPEIDPDVTSRYRVKVAGAPLSGLEATYDLDGGLDSQAEAVLPTTLGDPTTTNRLDVDFGFAPPFVVKGSIGDRVWKDLDADKIQDPEEWGLNGKRVYLYVADGLGGWTFLAQTTTATVAGVSGYYKFSDLPLATYTVIVDYRDVASYKQTYDLTAPLDHTAYAVELTSARPDRVDVDFGYTCSCVCKGSIGDYVWCDKDADGRQDCDEKGIPNVTVYLKGIGGITIGSTVTNSSGYYLFEDLVAGSYTVAVDPSTLPAGAVQTYDLIAPLDHTAPNVSLASGQNRRDVDFGYTCPCTRRYVTYTQGGWGACPSGNNPGMLLKKKFCVVFTDGYVKIGKWPCKYAKFTSASAITKFLPQGGKAATFCTKYCNPTKTSAGVFGGQVLALKLNVAFSDAGVTPGGLGDLEATSGKLAGWSVRAILDLANKVIGGDTSALPCGLSISGLNDIVTRINENFDGGTTDNGYLR